MLIIYLVRHGETIANKRGLYYGCSDIALNDRGIQQANALAYRLKSITFDKVICSGLQRTRQTAHIIAPQADITSIAEFNELDFGEWEGQHYRDLQIKDSQRYHHWCKNWLKQAPPGGESFDNFRQRVNTAWQTLLSSQSAGHLLFVGHQGPLRLLMLTILNLPTEAFWQFTFHQDAYSLLRFENDHGIIEKING